ncbi:unnamed protein product [Paramecium octaurelia]|uniref:Uncharacterized protein n=1 Tax=Paramecium octaurelia TaxID=43137 RepID=A0A8S1SJI0_PAROT|nr:unnamed protein product [Paramecium octaurelia]
MNSKVLQNQDDFYEVLAYLKFIDSKILQLIIEMLKKEAISDSLSFLSQDENQECWVEHILVQNLSQQDKQKKLNQMKQAIQSIHTVYETINSHDFTINNYSPEQFIEYKYALIKKIIKQN